VPPRTRADHLQRRDLARGERRKSDVRLSRGVGRPGKRLDIWCTRRRIDRCARRVGSGSRGRRGSRASRASRGRARGLDKRGRYQREDAHSRQRARTRPYLGTGPHQSGWADRDDRYRPSCLSLIGAQHLTGKTHGPKIFD
jgi:hypothetical protein